MFVPASAWLPYAAYDYAHSYNKNTKIKPVKIEFPEPYYKIEGSSAVVVYGNYIDKLFLLKKNGILKARGDFQ
ncbi:hypothetical protein [Microbulbifer sp. JTAC008]|uniref:hypothetical protein n=1 Tax=unclassified Microbulbifer TaxID=2619833 RepID=UPI00403A3BC7